MTSRGKGLGGGVIRYMIVFLSCFFYCSFWFFIFNFICCDEGCFLYLHLFSLISLSLPPSLSLSLSSFPVTTIILPVLFVLPLHYTQTRTDSKKRVIQNNNLASNICRISLCIYEHLKSCGGCKDNFDSAPELNHFTLRLAHRVLVG